VFYYQFQNDPVRKVGEKDIPTFVTDLQKAGRLDQPAKFSVRGSGSLTGTMLPLQFAVRVGFYHHQTSSLFEALVNAGCIPTERLYADASSSRMMEYLWARELRDFSKLNPEEGRQVFSHVLRYQPFNPDIAEACLQAKLPIPVLNLSDLMYQNNLASLKFVSQHRLVNISQEKVTELWFEIESPEMAEAFIKEDWIKDVNIQREGRFSLLQQAIGLGRLPLVQFLLTRPGINIELPTVQGRTPLHNACWVKNCQAVRVLVEAHANIHALDSEGKTPLHLLFLKRSESREVEQVKAIFNYLVDHGVDLKQRDHQGQTPLDCAKTVGFHFFEPPIPEFPYGELSLGREEALKLMEPPSTMPFEAQIAAQQTSSSGSEEQEDKNCVIS